MEAIWTVITPTTGNKSLLNLKEKLKKEQLPYVHLVMMDDKRVDNALTPEEIEDDVTFVYEVKHPTYRRTTDRMDVYLRGVGISLARTKYIKCADDDTWPENNHLEQATEFLEKFNLDFCWCIRKMFERNGNPIGFDLFEATGFKNDFGYNLLDNSSIFFNRKAGDILSSIFLSNTTYGDDRLTWQPLMSYSKGGFLRKHLINHMAQPELEAMFKKHCKPCLP